MSRPEEGERGTRVEVVRGAKGLGRAKVGVIGVVGIMGGEVSFSIERASANNQKQYIKKEGKQKGKRRKSNKIDKKIRCSFLRLRSMSSQVKRLTGSSLQHASINSQT